MAGVNNQEPVCPTEGDYALVLNGGGIDIFGCTNAVEFSRNLDQETFLMEIIASRMSSSVSTDMRIEEILS